jgi:hypothetical protein
LNFSFSKHALEELERRNIPRMLVEEFILGPERATSKPLSTRMKAQQFAADRQASVSSSARWIMAT